MYCEYVNRITLPMELLTWNLLKEHQQRNRDFTKFFTYCHTISVTVNTYSLSSYPIFRLGTKLEDFTQWYMFYFYLMHTTKSKEAGVKYTFNTTVLKWSTVTVAKQWHSSNTCPKCTTFKSEQPWQRNYPEIQGRPCSISQSVKVESLTLDKAFNLNMLNLVSPLGPKSPI